MLCMKMKYSDFRAMKCTVCCSPCGQRLTLSVIFLLSQWSQAHPNVMILAFLPAIYTSALSLGLNGFIALTANPVNPTSMLKHN